MASPEKLEGFVISADGSTLYISPPEGSEFQTNSEYVITITGLTTTDGTAIPTVNIDTIMPLSPMYCTLGSVSALVSTFDIPKKDMLVYIRDASLEADFIEGSTYGTSSDRVQFAKQQFVKTKVVLDCLMRSMMEATSSGVGARYKLDAAEIEESLNTSAYKALLADLWKDLLKWQDAIRGYVNEGRAKPKATRIGLKSDQNSDISHTTADKILNDISRTTPERNE